MSVSQKLRKMVELTQLHKHFQTYFRVVPAVTDELVAEAQKIRHAVYCEELGWEPISPDGREKDYFDQHAVHCLLRSVTRDSFIGCIRLVLPSDDGVSLSLPFQKACAGKLEAGHPDPVALANGEIAEVSRLAISKDFRRRRNEKGTSASFGAEEEIDNERRKFPYIPVALYLGMLEMASQRNIKTLYILTEPVLAKHFSRLGGKLEPVGEGIEHRGLRVPYRMDVEAVLHDARLVLRPLIRTIRKDINSYIKSADAGQTPSF